MSALRHRAARAAALLVATLLAAAGLAAWRLGALPGVRERYRTSDPGLAVAYRAKEACSCLFVDGRDEAACLAWTRADPDVARLSVDAAGRAVEARALLLWSARARWAGRREGCVLE